MNCCNFCFLQSKSLRIQIGFSKYLLILPKWFVFWIWATNQIPDFRIWILVLFFLIKKLLFQPEMVLNGILPVDQLRDHVPSVNLMLQYIPTHVLEYKYGLVLPQVPFPLSIYLYCNLIYELFLLTYYNALCLFMLLFYWWISKYICKYALELPHVHLLVYLSLSPFIYMIGF